MLMKAFSYAMIGVLAFGLATTAFGTAQTLLNL